MAAHFAVDRYGTAKAFTLYTYKTQLQSGWFYLQIWWLIRSPTQTEKVKEEQLFGVETVSNSRWT